MTARQFTNVFEPLHRRGFRVIAPDLPGFGNSDPAPFVPAIEDWAASVVAVLDALGLRAAHVLGHHTGGLVATEVAVQYPERVEKLIINGPLPMSDEMRRKRLDRCKATEVGFVYDANGAHLQNTFDVRVKFYGEGFKPEDITRYVVEKFQGRAPFWIGHHAAFLYDHGTALAKITVPALILTNTGDLIYSEAKEARAIRPDFAYTELEGGGIDVVDQMPEAWADAVAAFLDSP